MKLAISALIVLAIYSFNSFAQNDKTSKIHKFHQLRFGSAISFPRGDYGSTDINEKSSGFAETGYSFDISYQYHLKKIPIAFYSAVTFSGYEIDFKIIDTEKKKAQPDVIYRSYARTSTISTIKIGLSG